MTLLLVLLVLFVAPAWFLVDARIAGHRYDKYLRDHHGFVPMTEEDVVRHGPIVPTIREGGSWLAADTRASAAVEDPAARALRRDSSVAWHRALLAIGFSFIATVALALIRPIATAIGITPTTLGNILFISLSTVLLGVAGVRVAGVRHSRSHPQTTAKWTVLGAVLLTLLTIWALAMATGHG
jgi:hypothetical protein